MQLFKYYFMGTERRSKRGDRLKEAPPQRGRFTNIKYPISLWEVKLEAWKKDLKSEEEVVGVRGTQLFKETQQLSQIGWGFSLYFHDLPEGLCTHTLTCDVQNSRRDEAPSLRSRDFVCRKKCFKYKELMRWRLIMNSLPLLNVSSQPNVRGYSVRGYRADWKCQTERSREREHEEETKGGTGAHVLVGLRRVPVVL